MTAHSLELLWVLIAKEFKLKYKNTILGFLWSFAYPVGFSLVLFVAFQRFLKVGVENYFTFLLAGMFPWQWFASSLARSPSVFIQNRGLVKKVYFPRILLPASVIGNQTIHFLLALAVAIPAVVFKGTAPSAWWLAGIPLLLLVQFTLTLGFALLLSSLNVFFRDLEHVTIVLTGMFIFLTPIVYPEDAIPASWRVAFWANPMYWIIPSWRNLILHGSLDPMFLAMGAGSALFWFVVGYGVYRRMEWRFVESI